MMSLQRKAQLRILMAQTPGQIRGKKWVICSTGVEVSCALFWPTLAFPEKRWECSPLTQVTAYLVSWVPHLSIQVSTPPETPRGKGTWHFQFRGFAASTAEVCCMDTPGVSSKTSEGWELGFLELWQIGGKNPGLSCTCWQNVAVWMCLKRKGTSRGIIHALNIKYQNKFYYFGGCCLGAACWCSPCPLVGKRLTTPCLISGGGTGVGAWPGLGHSETFLLPHSP